MILITIRLCLVTLLLLVADICSADDATRAAEIAQKQLEVELASSNLWLRLRWGIADWLPWFAGAGILFAIWQWGLTRCPQCRRRFPKHLSGHTVSLPTTSRSGLVVTKYRCRGCAHEWTVERPTFRTRVSSGLLKSRSSSGSRSSSSRSSRSSKGFGGGSSGGGGSTRGY